MIAQDVILLEKLKNFTSRREIWSLFHELTYNCYNALAKQL